MLTVDLVDVMVNGGNKRIEAPRRLSRRVWLRYWSGPIVGSRSSCETIELVLRRCFRGSGLFLLSAHRCLDSRRIIGFGQVLEATQGLHHFSNECLLLHITGE